jgi:SAM-dependent methyltransferase
MAGRGVRHGRAVRDDPGPLPPIPGLRRRAFGGVLLAARENLGYRAVLRQGNATAIPLEDESVDVTVSGLVLNFVPDPRAGLAEMARVTVEGGMIAAYV